MTFFVCDCLSAVMLHHCRDSPLLLPGCLHLDVFGRRAALPDADRGL